MLKKEESFLRIGKIPYANLFPIYYYLENKCDNTGYRFVNGVPSSLNRMLREGKIDVSLSSSIEYLRHKKKYSIIPHLSVSSVGPVCSIFLFSKLPLESLNKKTIAVSSQSETSIVLLKIILSDFYSLTCSFVTVESNPINKLLSSFSACLLIGDEAMKEAKKQSAVSRNELTAKPSLATHHPSPYIYDLGELWFRHTGLPFVFALWIARKQSLFEKKGLIKKFASDLLFAKRYAIRNFSFIARHAPQRKWLSEKKLIDYWKGMSYEFTERHIKGLKLFEKHARRR